LHHPLAALSDPLFPLPYVKEQARERHTGSTLPRYYGNANNNCKMFFHAKAVFMPGREFSGGFLSRRGTTPQMPISWDCPPVFLEGKKCKYRELMSTWRGMSAV
jgi:hypothetical protein